MKNLSHFSIQSLSDYLGDKWELCEHPKEFDIKDRFSIYAKLEVDAFSIPNNTKALRDLFLNSPLVVDEIAQLKELIAALENTKDILQEEIKRLSVFESYYNLHFKMKHGDLKPDAIKNGGDGV